ncbi:MAG: hypothetical protein WCG75_12105 [Armatimonadota bacterium]
MLRIAALICYLLWDYGFFIESTVDALAAQLFILMIGTFYYAINNRAPQGRAPAVDVPEDWLSEYSLMRHGWKTEPSRIDGGSESPRISLNGWQ